jgi:hypothetical protein
MDISVRLAGLSSDIGDEIVKTAGRTYFVEALVNLMGAKLTRNAEFGHKSRKVTLGLALVFPQHSLAPQN